MATARNKPAKMRHSPADNELVERLDRLRPWQDTGRVAPALGDWANARGGSVKDGSDVAQVLRLLGQYDQLHVEQLGGPDPGLDRENVAGITAFMLRNVSLGRRPTNYGMDSIVGIPERTRRRYIERHGLNATTAWLESWQYRHDVYRLVTGGRSAAAARRWLERNPGKHAGDAPPPQKRTRTAESGG